MTDGQTLFLVLSILYLSDCFVWIGRRSVLFSSGWCGRWCVRFAGECFGNSNGGVAMRNPLPPLGRYVLAHWTPVSLSPDGVCSFTLQGLHGMGRPVQPPEALAYDEISEAARDGKHLLLNGSRFATCGGPEQASRLVKLIRRLLSAPPEQREKLIRNALAARFDREDALRRLQHMSALAAGLRWTCSTFFLFLYAFLPVMATVYGLSRLIIPAAIVMFLGAACIATAYFRAHKALCPSQSHERLSNTAKMMLCPPGAIRAADALTLDALSQFHPLLLADTLLGPARMDFARAVVDDLRHPMRHEVANPKVAAIASWHAARELEACTEFMESRHGDALENLLPPPQWDGAASAYCPRCSCQLTRDSGECPDCPGVALVPFPTIRKGGRANG